MSSQLVWKAELRALCAEVPLAEVPDLIGELARAQALAESRLRSRAEKTEHPSEPGRILTAREAAEMLGMSVQYVYRHKSELGAYRLGSSVRFTRSSVMEYRDRRREGEP